MNNSGVMVMRRSVTAAAVALALVGSVCGCSLWPVRPAKSVTPAGEYTAVTSDILVDKAMLITFGADGPIESRRLKGIGMDVTYLTKDRWVIAGSRSLDLVTITPDGNVKTTTMGKQGVGLTGILEDPRTGTVYGILNGFSGRPGQHMPLIDLAHPADLHRMPIGHYTDLIDNGNEVIATGADIDHPDERGRLVIVDKKDLRMRMVDADVVSSLMYCVSIKRSEVTCVDTGTMKAPQTTAVVISTRNGRRLVRRELGTESHTVFAHAGKVWIETKKGLTQFDSRLRPLRSVPLPANENFDSVTVDGDTAHVVTRFDHRRPLDKKRVHFGTVTAIDLRGGTVVKKMPLILPNDDLITTIRIVPRSWFRSTSTPAPS